MTLSDFITALTNTGATIKLVDSQNAELIRFVASGSAQLLATTLASTVDKITVEGSNQITVKLSAGE